MTLAQAPRFSGGSTVARCRHKCRNGAISPLVRPAIAPRGGLAGPGPGSLQLPSMSLSSIVARASWKASADRGWRELWERDPTAHSVVETLRQDLSALVQSDDGTSSGGVAPAEWARPFVDDPDALPAALVSLTDILGLDTPLRTVELVRSRPEILSISLSEVVERVLRMKELLPNANVLAVLQMRPELLVMPGAEAAMERALRTMLKLMPGIPVAEQLERGGSQWRTFVDLIGAELPASARMRSVKQKAALKEAVGRRRRGPPPIE